MVGATEPGEPAAAAAPKKKKKKQAGPRKRNQGSVPQSWWSENVEWAGLCAARLLFAPFGPRGRSRAIGWVGRRLGPHLWFASRINENIDLVRPEFDTAQRRLISRGVMENFARTAIEYMDLPTLFEDSAGFPVEGGEHLDAALQAGGGRLIVVSAHFGNWEAVRAVAALRNAPLGIIYRAFNNRKMDEYSFDLITACGWPAFRKGAEGSRALFKHVRDGGGAMILVDQRLGGAPSLDFMGQPAETSLAAAQLSLKLKAPLLPARALRTPTGFTVRFEPVIAPSDPVQMSAAVNDVIAGWVDEAPEQWFWLHRRWRRRGWGGELRTYGRERDGAGETPTI